MIFLSNIHLISNAVVLKMFQADCKGVYELKSLTNFGVILAVKFCVSDMA